MDRRIYGCIYGYIFRGQIDRQIDRSTDMYVERLTFGIPVQVDRQMNRQVDKIERWKERQIYIYRILDRQIDKYIFRQIDRQSRRMYLWHPCGTAGEGCTFGIPVVPLEKGRRASVSEGSKSAFLSNKLPSAFKQKQMDNTQIYVYVERQIFTNSHYHNNVLDPAILLFQSAEIVQLIPEQN